MVKREGITNQGGFRGGFIFSLRGWSLTTLLRLYFLPAVVQYFKESVTRRRWELRLYAVCALRVNSLGSVLFAVVF